MNEKKKPGRNDKCFCGSGKKYKRCHLNPHNPSPDANEIQRKLQQGLGKPIESRTKKQKREVKVGNKVYEGSWVTFHDFLVFYIYDIFGYDSASNKFTKVDKNDHPLNLILKEVQSQRQAIQPNHKNICNSQMTGAMSLLLCLAYNLYLITHNFKIQSKLISDLKIAKQFIGANYETYVAAFFVKAGFDLEFEDETDRTTSHCEFTATYKPTSEKYSVEAKSKNWKSKINPAGEEKLRLNFIPKLSAALKKRAIYRRIIFIELNLPTEMFPCTDETGMMLAKKIERHESLLINGKKSDPAYIFLTNHPYAHGLEKNEPPAYFPAGYKIQNYGRLIRSAEKRVESQKQHVPIYKLLESIEKHHVIPATFDGNLPEFEFGETENRLIIGEIYEFDGIQVKLINGTVQEKEKLAWVICQDKTGRQAIYTVPLSDAELRAYKASPDTFFGEYYSQGKKCKSWYEYYEFLYNCYKNSTKSKLLNLLKDQHDYPELKSKKQNELVEIYCTRIAKHTWNSEK